MQAFAFITCKLQRYAKGDYYRYLAEFLQQEDRSKVAGQANEAYDEVGALYKSNAVSRPIA